MFLLLFLLLVLLYNDGYIIRRCPTLSPKKSRLKLMKLHVVEIPLQRNTSMYQTEVKYAIDKLNDDSLVHNHIIKWYLVKMTNSSAIAEVIVDVRK